MIRGGMCEYLKLAWMQGVHTPRDMYKLALYGEEASLSPLTRAYTPAGEVVGKGYIAGGQVLRGLVQDITDGVAWMSWKEQLVWLDATISARGALVYNASKQNQALGVYDFEETIRSTNGPFRVPIPAPSVHTALFYIA